MRIRGWVTLALALFLPGVVLAPAWRLGGLGAGEDELLYYFPMRVLLHELLTSGTAPWLNPLNGLDRPLAADPQVALFYPPNWGLLWLPPLSGFAVTLWLHYSLALLGMHRWLRACGLDHRAALLGGVVFAFGSFLVVHRVHLTIVQAAAWAPLVFWRMDRYAAHGGNRRLVSAALVAAMQCLAGHVQIAAITVLGSAVYLAARSGPPRAWVLPLLRCGLAWAWAAALFAVQLLPTLAYVSLCTRTERGLRDFVENSLNPLALVSFVCPFIFGQRTPNWFAQEWWGPSHQVEQLQYVGLLPLLLGGLALGRAWQADAQRRAWTVLALTGLLVGLGQFAPPAYLLYWLPGAGLLRVPSRAMLLFHLGTAALAAWTLHQLAADPTPLRARLRAAGLRLVGRLPAILGAAAALLLIAAASAWPWLDAHTRTMLAAALRPWNPALWCPLLLLICSAWALRRALRAWDQPGFLWLLAGVLVLDLCVLGWSVDVPRDAVRPSDLLDSPARRELASAVQRAPGRLWIIAGRWGARYTPGEYIRPIDKLAANTNILSGVSSLTDYGPLQPRMLHARFPLHPWGELPEWIAFDRAPIAAFLLRQDWRRAFDVAWLLLCDPRDPLPPGCAVEHVTAEGFRLVRNPNAAGPAFFADARLRGTVWLEGHSPQRFTLHVAPGTATEAAARAGAEPAARSSTPLTEVVVSRLALPGWSASCAGARVPIQVAEGCLLSVSVPIERGVSIDFAYSPPGLRTGAAITLAALAVCAVLYVNRATTRKRGDPSGTR